MEMILWTNTPALRPQSVDIDVATDNFDPFNQFVEEDGIDGRHNDEPIPEFRDESEPPKRKRIKHYLPRIPEDDYDEDNIKVRFRNKKRRVALCRKGR